MMITLIPVVPLFMSIVIMLVAHRRNGQIAKYIGSELAQLRQRQAAATTDAELDAVLADSDQVDEMLANWKGLTIPQTAMVWKSVPEMLGVRR